MSNILLQPNNDGVKNNLNLHEMSLSSRNQFIERALNRFGYAPHGRVDKGVLLRYIERMTGLSRQQVARLVRRYSKDGKLTKRQGMAPARGFTHHYRGNAD